MGDAIADLSRNTGIHDLQRFIDDSALDAAAADRAGDLHVPVDAHDRADAARRRPPGFYDCGQGARLVGLEPFR